MKLSIIVPVYNVEKYLNACLKSIVTSCSEENYNNVEIILVNDGSTDNSLEICEFWAKKFSFIKVINKENGGLSDARNFGLKEAQGIYVAFVDSDDIVSDNYVDKILSVLRSREDTDLVIFEYLPFTNQSDLIKASGENELIKISKIEAYAKLTGKAYSKNIIQINGNYAWNKVYRTELFNDIKYPVGKKYEDIPVTYKLVDKSENDIYLLNSLMYYYRDNPASITKNSNLTDILDMLNGLTEMEEFFKLRGYDEILDAVRVQKAEVLIWYLSVAYKNSLENTNECKKIEFELANVERKNIKKLTLKKKIQFWFVNKFKIIYKLRK